MNSNCIHPPGEGETLLLRPPSRNAKIVLKVDPHNGGAKHFAMGTHQTEPGGHIPVHLHETQEEILFVHSGEAAITLGDERVNAPAGTTVYVPPKTWHGVENTVKGPLVLLWVISPPGLEEMFREISYHPGETPQPLSVTEFTSIAAKHRQVQR